MKSLLIEIDAWYRRRLRMVIWKQWKRIRTRFQNLMKLGISKFQAMMFSNTRKGYWHTPKAQSCQPQSETILYKKQVIYFSLLIIALFVGKLRNRRIPNGTYGGVRGQ